MTNNFETAEALLDGTDYRILNVPGIARTVKNILGKNTLNFWRF